MKKRGKKYRKSSHRGGGDLPGSNKENSFNKVFCSKEVIHDFRIKTTEPATRCYQFDNKTLKTMRTLMDREKPGGKQSKRGRKKNKSPGTDWFENNRNLNFPNTKISSVAFFIPLNTSVSHDPTNYTIDLSDLLFYESNKAALILRYQFEQDQKYEESIKNEILPPLRIKYRSISESSANSEDSVVCFENDDELSEDSCAFDIKSTSQSVDRKFENTSDLSEPSCSGVAPSQPQIRRVRFVDNTELVTVHLIIAWNYAYRAARISPWEVVARDSNRFRLKIQSLAPILNPVLTPEHREKIWKIRMHKHLENF